MGALESPDAANGALAMDTDHQGKAAKKQKSRGGKLAARLSPEEVRWCSCGSAFDVCQGSTTHHAYVSSASTSRSVKSSQADGKVPFSLVIYTRR